METLKKVIVALGASALIVSTSSASWISEWLQKANVGVSQESAGYYKSQAMGFLTGGSIRVRWKPVTNFTLWHWERPSINVGCNGIDATWGSFSYMSLKNLVKKISAIAGQAPAFATQLAISTLCKDCQAIIAELEDIVNNIGNMNFDACSIALNAAKNIGEALNDKIVEGLNGPDTFQTIQDYGQKTMQSVREYGAKLNAMTSNWDFPYNSPANQNTAQGSLMQMVYDKMKNNNSYSLQLLNQMTKKSLNEKQMVAFLRAIFGDLNGFTTKEGVAQYQHINPQVDHKALIQKLWVGEDINATNFKIYTYKGGECDKDAGCNQLDRNENDFLEFKLLSFHNAVTNNIDEIKAHIHDTNNPLKQNHLTFINQTNIPLFNILNLWAEGKIPTDERMVDFLSFELTKLVIDNLTGEISTMLGAIRANNSAGWANSADNDAYNDAKTRFESAKKELDMALQRQSQTVNEDIINKYETTKGIKEEIKTHFRNLARTTRTSK